MNTPSAQSERPRLPEISDGLIRAVLWSDASKLDKTKLPELIENLRKLDLPADGEKLLDAVGNPTIEEQLSYRYERDPNKSNAGFRTYFWEHAEDMGKLNEKFLSDDEADVVAATAVLLEHVGKETTPVAKAMIMQTLIDSLEEAKEKIDKTATKKPPYFYLVITALKKDKLHKILQECAREYLAQSKNMSELANRNATLARTNCIGSSEANSIVGNRLMQILFKPESNSQLISPEGIKSQMVENMRGALSNALNYIASPQVVPEDKQTIFTGIQEALR